ncbi:ATP-dependent DNA helicase pfh1-like, partial [Cotesia glomerata]|uniref:ATP-dependent DNA helicase pfh1-like n=1 Tax=Cotesia glomerata TaxID=32391 RepID=UPI001D002071
MDKNIPKNLEVFDDPTQEGDIAIDMNENEAENKKRFDDNKDVYYVPIPRLVSEENFMNLTKSLPLYHCVMGGAGVESTKVLLCAPTGKAAFEIKGTTLHAASILPLNQCSTDLISLSSGTRNTLYAKLKDLSLIIFDKISIVGSRMIQQVDSRLKQIFQSSKPFGGISVIVLGDFNQLAPVGDRYIFQAHSMDFYGDIIGNPLWNLFTSYQLTEIMWQKDDFKFAEALNNLAGRTLSKNDLKLFESRIVHNDDHIPKDAIHLFHVLRKNVIAIDIITGTCSNKMEQNLIDYCKNIVAKDAKGLPSNLSLSLGVKYMLTINIDVEDGLVNGAV